jgi:hypothetical protein
LQFQLDTIKHTTQALMQTVRPAVAFSLNIPDQFSPVQRQAIRQVLRDYPENENGASQVGPSVTVPQQQYFQQMSDLQKATTAVSEFQEVAKDQSEIITKQEKRIDANATILEMFKDKIKAKDHEILLLGQRVKELTDNAARYNQSLQQAENDRAKTEKLVKEYADMAKNTEEQIQAKEHALFELRKEFESLEYKLTMSQAKVRELQEAGDNGASQRQGPPRMTASASTFALGVHNLTRGAATSGRPQQTYRIVAPPAAVAAPQQAEVASIQSSTMACPVYNRRLSDPFRLAPAFDTPPRAEEVPEVPKLPVAVSQDRNKPLPSPPAVVATPSPGRRVLTSITEASQEDSVAPSSTTSSDREAVRRSIVAFDALNSQRSPVVDFSPSQEAMLVERRRALRKVASDELSMQQLYHHGRRRQM